MINIYDDDTLVILVTVLDNDGNAKDLSAATIIAKAQKSGSADALSATTAVTSASEGKFTATFAEDAFTAGKWLFQARVDIGTESQIVAQEHIQVDKAVT